VLLLMHSGSVVSDRLVESFLILPFLSIDVDRWLDGVYRICPTL
jgi:hypothetical protein